MFSDDDGGSSQQNSSDEFHQSQLRQFVEIIGHSTTSEHAADILSSCGWNLEVFSHWIIVVDHLIVVKIFTSTITFFHSCDTRLS